MRQLFKSQLYSLLWTCEVNLYLWTKGPSFTVSGLVSEDWILNLLSSEVNGNKINDTKGKNGAIFTPFFTPNDAYLKTISRKWCLILVGLVRSLWLALGNKKDLVRICETWRLKQLCKGYKNKLKNENTLSFPFLLTHRSHRAVIEES